MDYFCNLLDCLSHRSVNWSWEFLDWNERLRCDNRQNIEINTERTWWLKTQSVASEHVLNWICRWRAKDKWWMVRLMISQFVCDKDCLQWSQTWLPHRAVQEATDILIRFGIRPFLTFSVSFDWNSADHNRTFHQRKQLVIKSSLRSSRISC